jgi:hypothetical protein
MLTLLTHVVSMEYWPAFSNKPNGIATSMSVYAMEDMFHREW